jgi:hypothetical protein
MAGFIAITSEGWIEYLKNNRKDLDFAVFWCKKKTFKALKCGEDFYFLRRSSFKSNADRFIAGKGSFVEFKTIQSNIIWSEYGNSVGFEEEEEFVNNVRKIYGKEVADLGCIVLNNLVFYEKPVSIQECGIDFSPYIVSGKTITNEECEKIKAI